MIHRVVIALGSNTNQEYHIEQASLALSRLLSSVVLTRTMWTDDIHGSGCRYMNRMAAGYTTYSEEALNQQLKEIELSYGRTRQLVTIDLDLMQYDGQRYHLKDWPRPYIQQLIKELL